MRYFFDTEFVDGAFEMDLISIGVVGEDGREFYAVNSDDSFDWSPWLEQNVRPKLQPKRFVKHVPMDLDEIRANLLSFVGDDIPEWWAYYSAHDWVLLCWLMGGMLNMPQGWPMFSHDLRVALNEKGLQDIKDDGRDDEHNALADARWVRETWLKHLKPKLIFPNIGMAPAVHKRQL